MYPEGGYVASAALFHFPVKDSILPIVFHPNRDWLERVTRPRILGNLREEIPLKRHHIIPVGNMDFLWVLAQENSKIKRMTMDCKLYCSPDEGLTINAVEWAPWNLFIGPANRSDDPRNRKEVNKPKFFPEDLWSAITLLHEAIETAWNGRADLAVALRGIYKAEILAHLNDHDDLVRVPAGAGLFSGTPHITSSTRMPVRAYREAHQAVLNALKAVNAKLCKLKQAQNYVHGSCYGRCGYNNDYIEDEWVPSRSADGIVFSVKLPELIPALRARHR